MVAFARGCSEFLFVWAIASLGLYYLFAQWFAPPGPLWGGVIGGFFLASAWGLTRNAWISRSQRRLIQNSMDGHQPYGDQPYAAIGTAIALDSPLSTPLLQKPCVLYAYELFEMRQVRTRTNNGSRTDNRKVVHIDGLAMTEWAVLTKSGPVRVCGFPVPDNFEKVVIDKQRYASRIREFCDETDFTRIEEWEVGPIFSAAGIMLSEASGPVRRDHWFDEADSILNDPHALNSCQLTEQAILVDQPICVIGKFDQAHNGLVNDLSTGGLLAFPGEPSQAMQSLRTTSRVYLALASLALLIGTLGNFGILHLRERSLVKASLEVDRSEELFLALQANDLTTLTRLLSEGLSTDARDSVGRTVLLAAIDRGNLQAIEALLEAGADVNASQIGWNRRPIEAAFDRHQLTVLDRLKSLGATGDYVDKESGTPMQDEFTELATLLNEYTRALDESDQATMQSIASDWPSDFLDSLSRGVYKETRPTQWECLEGYRAGDLCTFLAQGPTRSGAIERYVVTAKMIDGDWRLRRIHWDETFAFAFEDRTARELNDVDKPRL